MGNMFRREGTGKEAKGEYKSTNLLHPGMKTRLAALFALVFSASAFVISIWLLFAIWHAGDALKRNGFQNKFDANFDEIAAAAAVGRLDLLSIILTIFGVLAAIALIYGGTVYRSAAIAAAREEARELVPNVLAEHMRTSGVALVSEALKSLELLAVIQAGVSVAGLQDTNDNDADLIETSDPPTS